MLACCVSGVMNPIAICLSLVMCLKSYGIGSGSFFFGVFGFAPLPQMSSLVQILEDLGEEVKLKRLWKGALFVRIWIYGWKQVQKSSRSTPIMPFHFGLRNIVCFQRGFFRFFIMGLNCHVAFQDMSLYVPFLSFLFWFLQRRPYFLLYKFVLFFLSNNVW